MKSLIAAATLNGIFVILSDSGTRLGNSQNENLVVRLYDALAISPSAVILFLQQTRPTCEFVSAHSSLVKNELGFQHRCNIRRDGKP